MPSPDISQELQTPYLLKDEAFSGLATSELGIGAVSDPEFARFLRDHTGGDPVEIRDLISRAYMRMPILG